MKRTYDIYFRETLCGTAWARTVDGGEGTEIRIECFLKYRDVPEIGLRRARAKSLHVFSADGRPRRIEMSDDRGNSGEITLSDVAVNYGEKDIPLDRPVDFALESNMVPLLAIWWEEIKGRATGTFRTLISGSGALSVRPETY